jgi:hypothetical protein
MDSLQQADELCLRHLLSEIVCSEAQLFLATLLY